MIRKIAVFLIILVIFIAYYFYSINKKNDEKLISNNEDIYNSNLLENLKYVAKDNDGNQYIIKASEGEIDLNNSDVIF